MPSTLLTRCASLLPLLLVVLLLTLSTAPRPVRGALQLGNCTTTYSGLCEDEARGGGHAARPVPTAFLLPRAPEPVVELEPRPRSDEILVAAKPRTSTPLPDHRGSDPRGGDDGRGPGLVQRNGHFIRLSKRDPYIEDEEPLPSSRMIGGFSIVAEKREAQRVEDRRRQKGTAPLVSVAKRGVAYSGGGSRAKQVRFQPTTRAAGWTRKRAGGGEEVVVLVGKDEP